MSGILIQLLATLLISMLPLLGSFGTAWPSYTLKLLKSEQSPIGYPINENHVSLIGSSVLFGACFGPFIVGFMTDRIGRKRMAMLCGLSFILAWSIKATAKSVTQLVIGRLMIGVGLAMQFIVAVVYVGEICHPSLRGPLTSGLNLMFNLGTLLSYVEGWLCSYHFVIYSALSLSVLVVVLMYWLKESPSFLLGKGMDKEAMTALKFYRGQSTTTQEILDELQYLNSLRPIDSIAPPELILSSDDANQKLNNEKVDVEHHINTEKSVFAIFRTSKSSRNALINLCLLMVSTVCMGMMGITTYAGQILAISAPRLSPDLCSVVLAIVITVSSGISVVIIDLVPRRVLMISGCLLSSASMAALAGQLRWSWGPDWTVLLFMVMFSLFYNLGVASVPFVQLGECFSPQVKNVATSTVLFSMAISNFCVLYLLPHCVGILGIDVTFFIFGVLCLLTGILAYFIMRETKTVPFEEIQRMFEDRFLYKKHTI